MTESANVRVLAAVIEAEGRYLICLRPAHKRHGGLWEFPGGKLEPGESLLQAAQRELREELGVQVERIGSTLLTEVDPGSHYHIEFVPVEIRGDPQGMEHDELRWVTLAGMLELPLAPADRRFAEFVRAGGER
ncbi:MAG: (deoxy)nucleoside triphosphate pyrophosphohydrolase [Longimicrobiales bacterium]